jgi:hypothetical protein
VLATGCPLGRSRQTARSSEKEVKRVIAGLLSGVPGCRQLSSNEDPK